MANEGKVQCPTMVHFNRRCIRAEGHAGPCGGGSSRLELESTNADFVTHHSRRWRNSTRTPRAPQRGELRLERYYRDPIG
jgi:hypothetical protein